MERDLEVDKQHLDAAGGHVGLRRSRNQFLDAVEAREPLAEVDLHVLYEIAPQSRGPRHADKLALLARQAEIVGQFREPGVDPYFLAGKPGTRQQNRPRQDHPSAGDDRQDLSRFQNSSFPTTRDAATLPNSCSCCGIPRLSPTTKYSDAPSVVSGTFQGSRN